MKEDYRELHREIATTIASRCDDPAQWLAEVRRIGDALDLPAQRWLKLPATLEAACFDLVVYASHDGRMTPERVREATGAEPTKVTTAPAPALLTATLICIKNGMPVRWSESHESLLDWAKEQV